MNLCHTNLRLAGCCLLLALSTFAFRSQADETAQFSLKVAGLRVVAPAPGGNDHLRAFNWSPGVTIAMLVTAKEGCLLGFDRQNSKLNAFTDDKGGDLLKGDSNGGIDLGSFQSFDHTNALLLEIKTRSLPTKGATELMVSGDVFVETAGRTRQFKTGELEFKAGTEFSIGKTKLKISKVTPTASGCNLILEANQSLESISNLEFIDEEGNKVESRKYGSSSSTSPSGTFVQWDLSLNKKLERGEISAVCWQDLKTVEVPVSIKTGVGL